MVTGDSGPAAFENPPDPMRLVARTVTVKATSGESPVIVQVSFVDVQKAPPGSAVALYDVIADPPVEVGASQVTVRLPLPAVIWALRGGPGTVIDAGSTTDHALAQ